MTAATEARAELISHFMKSYGVTSARAIKADAEGDRIWISSAEAEADALLDRLVERDKRVAEKTWDECLDAIEKHELNTEQARAGNPYR